MKLRLIKGGRADMEDDVVRSLTDCRIGLEFIKDGRLVLDIAGSYMNLCCILTNELKTRCSLVESVSCDPATFLIDICGFLRELKCPYSMLTDIEQCGLEKNRLLLLDYLTSEVQACRMIGKQPVNNNKQAVTVNPVLHPVRAILKSLQIQLPPLTEDVAKVFAVLENKIKTILSELPENHLGNALVKQKLNEYQLLKLDQISQSMSQDYRVRKQMLLKRLDVTIQSFGWSDRVKSKLDDMQSVFRPIRNQLEQDYTVTIPHILAARDNLLNFEKTSSGMAREATKCDINKVLIGKVPDRGGRPSSMAPPVEMPSFRKRIEPISDGRGGGRGGRGSGRVQGGAFNYGGVTGGGSFKPRGGGRGGGRGVGRGGRGK